MNTQTKKMKIGVIGGGEGATKALSGLVSCDTIQIKAVVCDDKELTDLIKPTTWCSMHDLLHSSDIDAVYIATPNNTHVDLAMDVLAAGKHVMIEKPMAVSFHDALRLKALKSSKPSIAVAFKKRFGDGIVYFKNIVAMCQEPISIKVKWHSHAPHGNWRYHHAISGGGIVMDLGSHVLDLLEFLFGRILDMDVSLKMAEIFPQIDEEALIKLDFANGHSAVIDLSWRQKEACQIYSFFSSDKAFHLERKNDGMDLGTFTHRNETKQVSFKQSSEYIGLFTAWKDAIENQNKMVPQLEDGLKNQSIMQTIYAVRNTKHHRLFFNKDNYYGISN